MADKFPQVSPGQPLSIPAPTWNALMEVGRQFDRRRGVVTPPPPGDDPLGSTVRVLVQNNTGSTLNERSVVTLSTPPITPTTAPLDFQRAPIFFAVAPGSTSDVVAILETPLADGEIGRATVLGAAVVSLSVGSSGHGYCGPTAGQTGYLTTAATGPIRILWKESGTGTKLGVVLLQKSSDPAATTNTLTYSGSTLTSTVNGVAATATITPFTPANWSTSVSGYLTTAAQTGGGRKTTIDGTDATTPGWHTNTIQTSVMPVWTPYIAYLAPTGTGHTITSGSGSIEVAAYRSGDLPVPFSAVQQVTTSLVTSTESGSAGGRITLAQVDNGSPGGVSSTALTNVVGTVIAGYMDPNTVSVGNCVGSFGVIRQVSGITTVVQGIDDTISVCKVAEVRGGIVTYTATPDTATPTGTDYVMFCRDGVPKKCTLAELKTALDLQT